MAEQVIMEKVSNRIWVLLAGIAVAIAIAFSALAMQNPEPPSQAGDPSINKNKVSTLPAILIKKIYDKVTLDFSRAK